jgi:hypothetical protein
MVYDIKIHVPHVNNNFIKILTTKRCGVEFGELSDDNLAKLKLFLQINTTEPA